MTTALTIINRAYSLLGYKAAGEALGAEDTFYALDALNAMVDGWNTQRMFIVTVDDVVGTVSGVSANVGLGQTFDTVRPVTVENGAFTRLNGIDYPIEWIDRETYADISLKTVQSSFPQYAFYNNALPIGTVYFYPAPVAPVEVHLPLQVQLTAFADIATDYTLAPGYQKALEYSLAEELAPGIRPVDPPLMRIAANARRAIRRTNVEVPLLSPMPQNVRFNIYSGL